MPRKRRNRRVRGSDGKLYDPKKQKDNGHRAHESRVGTAARRTRWRGRGLIRSAIGGISRVGMLAAMAVWLFATALGRIARTSLGVLAAGCRWFCSIIAGVVGRSRRTGRSARSRVRRRRD